MADDKSIESSGTFDFGMPLVSREDFIWYYSLHTHTQKNWDLSASEFVLYDSELVQLSIESIGLWRGKAKNTHSLHTLCNSVILSTLLELAFKSLKDIDLEYYFIHCIEIIIRDFRILCWFNLFNKLCPKYCQPPVSKISFNI